MVRFLFSFFLFTLGELHAQVRYQSLLLYHVSIVNVSDGTIRENAAVLLEGNKIKAIGEYSQLKSGIPTTSHIDCDGKYLIPGLWDMHVHLEGADLIEDNKALLPVFLAYGITSVRDCASDLGEQVLAWRKKIKEGALVGPNLFLLVANWKEKIQAYKNEVFIFKVRDKELKIQTHF